MPEIPDQPIYVVVQFVGETLLRAVVPYSATFDSIEAAHKACPDGDVYELIKPGERESAYQAGREDALRWAADQIHPGPRQANVARQADRAMAFVIDADRGTAAKLRLWADQERMGEAGG